MRKSSFLVRQKLEFKTLAVVDRIKFRDYLNFMHNIQGYNFDCIKQLSNHALLLNVQKEGLNYQCYFTSITNKTKAVTVTTYINARFNEFKLLHGEFKNMIAKK